MTYIFFEELIFLIIAKYKTSLKLHLYELIKEPLLEKLAENYLDFWAKKFCEFNKYHSITKSYEELLFNDNNENMDNNGFFIAGELTETFYAFFKLGIFVLIYTTYPLIIIKTILWFSPAGTKFKKFNFSKILVIYLILFILIIWIVHSINLPMLWRFFSFEGLGTNIIETEIGLDHIVMFTIKNYIVFIFILHQTIIQFFQDHLRENFNFDNLNLKLKFDFKLSRLLILKLIHFLKFKTKLNNIFPITITKFLKIKNLHFIILKNFITKVRKIKIKNYIKLILVFCFILTLEELYKLKFYYILILYYLIILFFLLTQIYIYINIKYKANNGI
uniref:Sec-independent protein translocase component TatC n=1 Tax=Vischeria punctata TaxID=643629 RepID=UPI0021ABB2D0|nr:Sec-independent protein translocase component TatC [Vischeria punctata]UUA03912.1 Sec-independent protein translocase component TatC [Vischeria punctata]